MYERIIVAIVVAVALPLLSYAVGKLAELINAKVEQIDNAEAAAAIKKAVAGVEQAVLYVMQTYVDSLKRAGEFGADAQKEALQRAKKNALMLIDERSKDIIEEQYGGFEHWLNTRIEQTVRDTKIKE